FSRLRVIMLGVLHHVHGTPEICGRGERADLVVVEDLALTRSTGQHLTRAGLWHLVMNEIDNESIPYAIVSPTSLKKYVTGRGNGPRAPDPPMAGRCDQRQRRGRRLRAAGDGTGPPRPPRRRRAQDAPRGPGQGRLARGDG